VTDEELEIANGLVVEAVKLRAEIERLAEENKRLRRWIAPDIFELTDEIERLKEQVATCRELRKYDRIEIERMRILLDRKTP